eukprot:CAMPEP_0197422398 /NCGR_PEP_ID=MMETSP1170-20131217/15585_1 /TAXON_ID=54406 /ORGANISM="Sarcinochrysis sp, Strain CCMP770" /LENGTH=117 /DNA_ID=CAMNT_0042949733 /DNA_START=86 /DNA_END=435 /DNA_ORIENTATION=+
MTTTTLNHHLSSLKAVDETTFSDPRRARAQSAARWRSHRPSRRWSGAGVGVHLEAVVVVDVVRRGLIVGGEARVVVVVVVFVVVVSKGTLGRLRPAAEARAGGGAAEAPAEGRGGVV